MDQTKEGHNDDEDDYELKSGMKIPTLDLAYSSNKSKRGNITDRKSSYIKPSQSVLNYLVTKGKMSNEEFQTGSLSPKREAENGGDPKASLTMPVLRSTENISAAEVLTRVSQKDQVSIIGQGTHYALLKSDKASIDLKGRL